MKNGIVVIGAVFVDIKGFPDGIYVPDGRNAGRVELVHGGVGRNVAEDIANIELRPTFLSLIDNTATGREVREKLRRHKVNVEYLLEVPGGMGTWLAVFDNNGDLAGSISQRPELKPLEQLLDERGDEIFSQADSVVVEIDMDKEIIKRVFALAQRYEKPVFAVVSNMSIAAHRRDLLQRVSCLICNELEAGILFADDYSQYGPEQMQQMLQEKLGRAQIPSMVVTMGGAGAVYADRQGNGGYCPARRVTVADTTGAGDAFCAGVAIGLTYRKTLAEAVEIGTHLAASVITTTDNVCPRFLPRELGLDVEAADV